MGTTEGAVTVWASGSFLGKQRVAEGVLEDLDVDEDNVLAVEKLGVTEERRIIRLAKEHTAAAAGGARYEARH